MQFQQKFIIKALLFVIHYVFSKMKLAQKLQKLENRYLLNVHEKTANGACFLSRSFRGNIFSRDMHVTHYCSTHVTE